MIVKVYTDDLGYPVYEEIVENIDEMLLKELTEKRVVQINDYCIIELL